MNNLIAQAAATPPEESIRLIPLSQDKFAIVDAADYDWLNQWKWSLHSYAGKEYAGRIERIGTDRHTLKMHRLITSAPTGIEVDHRDGNGLNNTRSNLRLATHQQNSCNMKRHRDNNSGFKGVYWNTGKKRWDAKICVRGKHYLLGRFIKKEDAVKAYEEGAPRLHGEFARVNRG
ncbi:MAG TPA: HNH endonuclease [Candidatus Angelobacter sp.]|nr:HNH endonuclease [Candidatus Angelobacter sp.]